MLLLCEGCSAAWYKKGFPDPGTVTNNCFSAMKGSRLTGFHFPSLVPTGYSKMFFIRSGYDDGA
jgi:hypothetical protein